MVLSRTIISILICTLFAAVSISGCGFGVESGKKLPSQDLTTPDSVSQATLSRYREGEVKEYKGLRLDPAIGPRDNSISGIQHVNIADFKLSIDSLVNSPYEIDYEEVIKLTPYERKITLFCVEGWSATILWKGVLLDELISRADPAEEANTVIFHAVDGYTSSLPLSFIRNNELILAYGANGLTLPDEMGYPFIVVAEDKAGYKWVRWVNKIELSSDPSYRGFWEQSGYSIEGEIQ